MRLRRDRARLRVDNPSPGAQTAMHTIRQRSFLALTIIGVLVATTACATSGGLGQVPTVPPTAAPSVDPGPPDETPAAPPSGSPSASPSGSPSGSPSAAPSASPSAAPSGSPSPSTSD